VAWRTAAPQRNINMRALDETLLLLKAFGVQSAKLTLLDQDGTCLESPLHIDDINPQLLEGFAIGNEWVYPDVQKAFFNPFIKDDPVLLIPCFRQSQIKQGAVDSQVVAAAEIMMMNEEKPPLIRYSSSTDIDPQFIEDQSMRKIPKKGTSCHQCKNTKHLHQLAFCTNSFEKRSKSEKDKRMRSCRKKFCKICLQKFYNEDLGVVLNDPCWKCPSCRLECVCAACVRGRQKDPYDPNGEFDDCELEGDCTRGGFEYCAEHDAINSDSAVQFNESVAAMIASAQEVISSDRSDEDGISDTQELYSSPESLNRYHPEWKIATTNTTTPFEGKIGDEVRVE
jgi:hypothetical protein